MAQVYRGCAKDQSPYLLRFRSNDSETRIMIRSLPYATPGISQQKGKG